MVICAFIRTTCRYGVNGREVLKATSRINIQKLLLCVSKWAVFSDNLIMMHNNIIEMCRSVTYGMEDIKFLGIMKW